LRIAETARKHGIADEDMLHAVRNAMAEWEFEDDFTMLVGPARNADLLEVGVIGIETDEAVIVHAMPARSKFLPPH
jgi:hypothetical protein